MEYIIVKVRRQEIVGFEKYLLERGLHYDYFDFEDDFEKASEFVQFVKKGTLRIRNLYTLTETKNKIVEGNVLPY